MSDESRFLVKMLLCAGFGVGLVCDAVLLAGYATMGLGAGWLLASALCAVVGLSLIRFAVRLADG